MDSLIVKPITKNFFPDVCVLDDISGNDVAQWIEELEEDEVQDYAYGLFLGDKLIGYCTIGGADDVPEDIEKHECYSYNSLLLSDVFIHPFYRGRGFGLILCREAIKLKNIYNDTIYLTLLNDNLYKFYSKLGCDWCNEKKEYVMYK